MDTPYSMTYQTEPSWSIHVYQPNADPCQNRQTLDPKLAALLYSLSPVQPSVADIFEPILLESQPLLCRG